MFKSYQVDQCNTIIRKTKVTCKKTSEKYFPFFLSPFKTYVTCCYSRCCNPYIAFYHAANWQKKRFFLTTYTGYLFSQLAVTGHYSAEKLASHKKKRQQQAHSAGMHECSSSSSSKLKQLRDSSSSCRTSKAQYKPSATFRPMNCFNLDPTFYSRPRRVERNLSFLPFFPRA